MTKTMTEKTIIEEMLENMRHGSIRNEPPISGRSTSKHKDKWLENDSYGKSHKKEQYRQKRDLSRLNIKTCGNVDNPPPLGYF